MFPRYGHFNAYKFNQARHFVKLLWILISLVGGGILESERPLSPSHKNANQYA
jgi:hypothetical protein